MCCSRDSVPTKGPYTFCLASELLGRIVQQLRTTRRSTLFYFTLAAPSSSAQYTPEKSTTLNAFFPLMHPPHDPPFGALENCHHPIALHEAPGFEPRGRAIHLPVVTMRKSSVYVRAV